MVLSYLVAEHNDDTLVVFPATEEDEDEDDGGYLNNSSNVQSSGDNNDDSNNDDSNNYVMEEMIMMVEEGQEEDEDHPFDVVGSTDGGYNNNKKKRGQQQSQPPPPPSRPRQNPTRARTPTNEVGELPTLSISRSESAEQHQMFHRNNKNGTTTTTTTTTTAVVTGGRTTRVKPLSPPSRAGLDHPEVYNNNNNNKGRKDDDDGNGDNDDSHYDGGGHTISNTSTSTTSFRNRGSISYEEEEDNMPMDEQKDYIEQKTAAMAALCGVDESTSNFCDTTFTAMGEICGITDSKKKATTSSSNLITTPIQRTLSLGEKHTLTYAAGVEEQTAIEVEYVEPSYRGRNGDDDMYSPKRKNALLKAMAKRARDEFRSKKTTTTTTPTSEEQQQQQDEARRSSAVQPEDDGTSSSLPATENMYALFSPSEKRKFLQLINGGMTPTHATEQVVKDRRSRPAGGNATGEDVGVRGDLPISKKGSMLVDPKEVVVSPAKSVSPTDSAPSPHKKRGIGLAFWKRGKDKQNKVAETSTTPKSNNNNSSTNNNGSIPVPISSPARRNMVIVEVVDDDEGESEGPGFARSGISYYDAVRKEQPNNDPYHDDNDDDDESRNKKRTSSGRLSLPKFPKLIFSKLSKDEQDQLGETKNRTTAQLESVGRDRTVANVTPVAVPAKEGETLRHGESEDVEDSYDDVGDDDGGYEDEDEGGSTYDRDGADQEENIPMGVPHDEDYADDYPVQPIMAPPQGRNMANMGETVRPLPMPTPTDGNTLHAAGNEIRPTMSGESLLDENDGPGKTSIDQEEKKADHDEGQAIEDETTARMLGVTGAAAAADAAALTVAGIARGTQGEVDNTRVRDGQQDAKEPKRRNKQVELDMDTYLNSTESTSRGSFDHMSVVSNKSYKTSLTTGTNQTQSTRTRRPGQAKARLESEKGKAKNQTRVMGWQESIQAVAASTGKEWDPESGWKDYVDIKPGDDLGDQYGADSKAINLERHKQMKGNQDTRIGDQYVADSNTINLDRLNQTQGNQDTSTLTTEVPSETERAVITPHAPFWDAEQSATAESMYSEQIPVRQPSIRKNKSSKVVKNAESGPPRGWVETMKLATANLNVDGKHWNPETGWVGGNEEDPRRYHEADRAHLDDVARTAESDTQDFGTIHIPVRNLNGQPGGEDKTAAVVQLDAIADNQDSGLQFLSEDEEQATEDDLESTARSTGRYVQIADTGSVRSHYRNPPKKQTRDQQTRQQQLLNSMEEEHKSGTGSDMDHETEGYRSLLVNVKKQELNEADASYFTPSDPMNRGRGAVYMDDARVDAVQILEERASGPIDVDEVDDDDNSQDTASEDVQVKEIGSNGSFAGSFGGNSDFSWDAEDAANQVQHRKPVPRLRISIRESGSVPSGLPTGRSAGTQSEASYESTSSSPKHIPKISGPRRDTSPVRGRKPESSKSERSTSNLSDSGATDSTAPVGSSMSENKYNQAMNEESSKAQLAPELADTSNQDEGGNVSGDFGLSFYSKESQASSGAIVAAASAALVGDDGSSLNVRDLHSYWEARSNGSNPINKVDVQSSEWKAYLAKKVKSDVAAAAAAGRRDHRRDGQPDETDDRDTIFDFHESEGAFPTARKRGMENGRPGEPHEGAFEDISDLSPIRHDESDSDYAPSEVSTNIQHGGTFLQRLQACAAPLVTKSTENCGPSVPMAAHLAFLRSNPNVVGTQEKSRVSGSASGKAGSFNAPAGLCGRPDVIVEEDSDDADTQSSEAAEVTKRRMENTGGKKVSPKSSLPPVPRPEKQRSRSNPKSRQSSGSDVSSVISDEFGAKTAYFEALAMKAAVGSKKKRRSSGSDTSSNSGSKHSEKFQQFLDRRASKGDSTDPSEDQQQQSPSSPPVLQHQAQQQQLPSKKPPTGREDITARAERYASEKVEEMMDAMAGRSSPAMPLDYRGRPMDEETGAFPTLPRPAARWDPGHGTNNARLAAEELAAARVEAMMQSLSARNAVNEEEGEI